MTSDARYAELPVACDVDKELRRVGVEVEFSDITEKIVLEILQRHFGGTLSVTSLAGSLEDTALGTLKVELDTALTKFADGGLVERSLDQSRKIVPVEIVTDPLRAADLSKLDPVWSDLRKAGARGSRDGVLLGFGVHLNVAVVAPDHAHTLNTIRAYALLEDFLRAVHGIDATRRLLPFVSPWPSSLVDAFEETRPRTLAEAMRLYFAHVSSRNHGLDLLPLFKEAEPDLFQHLGGVHDSVSARPAFHFRLPDSRIDEKGWSLAQAWDMWRRVETVAAAPACLEALSAAWTARTSNSRTAWAQIVADILDENSSEAELA